MGEVGSQVSLTAPPHYPTASPVPRTCSQAQCPDLVFQNEPFVFSPSIQAPFPSSPGFVLTALSRTTPGGAIRRTEHKHPIQRDWSPLLSPEPLLHLKRYRPAQWLLVSLSPSTLVFPAALRGGTSGVSFGIPAGLRGTARLPTTPDGCWASRCRGFRG